MGPWRGLRSTLSLSNKREHSFQHVESQNHRSVSCSFPGQDWTSQGSCSESNLGFPNIFKVFSRRLVSLFAQCVHYFHIKNFKYVRNENLNFSGRKYMIAQRYLSYCLFQKHIVLTKFPNTWMLLMPWSDAPAFLLWDIREHHCFTGFCLPHLRPEGWVNACFWAFPQRCELSATEGLVRGASPQHLGIKPKQLSNRNHFEQSETSASWDKSLC